MYPTYVQNQSLSKGEALRMEISWSAVRGTSWPFLLHWRESPKNRKSLILTLDFKVGTSTFSTVFGDFSVTMSWKCFMKTVRSSVLGTTSMLRERVLLLDSILVTNTVLGVAQMAIDLVEDDILLPGEGRE